MKFEAGRRQKREGETKSSEHYCQRPNEEVRQFCAHDDVQRSLQELRPISTP